MIHVYGIPTCGSVKKGLAWFRLKFPDSNTYTGYQKCPDSRKR